VKRINYEFKARLKHDAVVRAALKDLGARYLGTDHQVDTYFHVPAGRLKIREGHIENALIYYQRSNARRARRSKIEMMMLPPRNSIRAILAAALGVWVVVDKRRQIYFVGNVKVHLDKVRGLGKFVEVEAISRGGNMTKVRGQALKFQKLFGIKAADIVPQSYSDLIAKSRKLKVMKPKEREV
jgi:adenylate cyclase, class 2